MFLEGRTLSLYGGPLDIPPANHAFASFVVRDNAIPSLTAVPFFVEIEGAFIVRSETPISALILSDTDLSRFRAGEPINPILSLPDTNSADLAKTLGVPGVYHFVFDNPSRTDSAKVSARIEVKWSVDPHTAAESAVVLVATGLSSADVGSE